MGMMDAPAADPLARPKQPASPSGGMMADPNPGQQTTPPPVTQQPGGMMAGGQQTGGGGGQTQPAPGPVQPGDWSSVALNEALMKSLPGLRTQAEAARQRLGPIAAGSADVAGNIGSPTTALNFVPWVGPELAGGLHEGIKSYNSQPNWIPDWQGTKQIAEDTAGGVASGALGQGTALAAKTALGPLIKAGAVYGAGTAAHQMLGGSVLGDVGKELPGLMGLYAGIDKTADWLGQQGKSFASLPSTQAAIKALTLGIGSAARTGAGPGLYNQWIPGQ